MIFLRGSICSQNNGCKEIDPTPQRTWEISGSDGLGRSLSSAHGCQVTLVSALRFFLTVTLGRADLAHQLARTHYPKKLPRVCCRPRMSLANGYSGSKKSSVSYSGQIATQRSFPERKKDMVPEIVMTLNGSSASVFEAGTAADQQRLPLR